MSIKMTLLTAACALALSACGDKSPPPAADTAAPPAASTVAAPAETMPPATTEATPAPGSETAPPADSMAPQKGSKVAVVANCATEIEGNDAMQYNVNSITVPSSCTDFKITLKHVGKMPVAAMGHNVVVTKSDDMQEVLADGMAAGIDKDYVKPGDDVVAHTKLIGGGQTASVSFPVSKIKDGGPYKFFCSFPGHAAMMNGTIAVQ